jgi:3',5'-cyclic AMP phosphodiesterase CpdA
MCPPAPGFLEGIKWLDLHSSSCYYHIMYHLAHLSDPHLGPLPRPSIWQLMSKRLTGYINWKRNRAKSFSDLYLNALVADLAERQIDHIALTGDLVNIALPEETRLAGIWLQRLGTPEHVSLVPGNHDAYTAGGLRNALQQWCPYMLGDQKDRTPTFPYLRRRGPLAIIGCSSAITTLPFMATGSFSRSQEEATAKLLEQTRECFRVVLIHHPPFPGATPFHKRLIGAERFRGMIAEYGAELVLHGHTHIHSHEQIMGPTGNVPVIGVPSASNGTGHKAPAGCYNLFSVQGQSNNWQVVWKKRGVLDAGGTIGPVGRDITL